MTVGFHLMSSWSLVLACELSNLAPLLNHGSKPSKCHRTMKNEPFIESIATLMAASCTLFFFVH